MLKVLSLYVFETEHYWDQDKNRETFLNNEALDLIQENVAIQAHMQFEVEYGVHRIAYISEDD